MLQVSQPAAGSAQAQAPSLSYDVFTELDPLGTGRSKPYVDKKLFFQELKNPPKKVLKDLVPTTQPKSDILPPASEAKSDYGPATTMTSLSRHSGGSVTIAKPLNTVFAGNFFASDPFAETDPFDNTDPFSDSFKDDPFTSIQDFPKTNILKTEEKSKMPDKVILDKVKPAIDPPKNSFNGPLQVSLPPEPAPKSPRLQRQVIDLFLQMFLFYNYSFIKRFGLFRYSRDFIQIFFKLLNKFPVRLGYRIFFFLNLSFRKLIVNQAA